MIKCNHCGAKNIDSAKICEVCGKEITQKEQFIGEGVKKLWYASTWFIILMLIVFWPVGLYLMWKYKKFSLVARIILTVCISAFWIYVIVISYRDSNVETSISTNAYTMKGSDKNIEKLGGIKFKVPEYYDVRETDDEDSIVHFYPEREDAHASLVFRLMKDSYNAEQVRASKDNIINNWKQTLANLNIEDEDRNDNYILKATGNKDGAKVKYVAAVNNEMKKIVSITLSVDDTDTTGYNYFDDFDNMINKISIDSSNKVENNESVPDSKSNSSSNSMSGVVSDFNNEIDNAKSQLNNEIDVVAESVKDEMGLAGKVFGGYIDEYKDAYKDAVNDVGDAYKDAMKEYGNTYDDIMKSFGY